MSRPEKVEFCVVGAGFAGLRIASSLGQSGAEYVVLDKGRSPGGRAATRRISEARVDHGIPWLTRTGGLSDDLIDRLREADLIERLFVGGDVGDVWSCPGGINSVAKYLAAELSVRFSQRVEWIEPPNGRGGGATLRIADADGSISSLEARHTIITAPVPQAIDIAPFLAGQTGNARPEEIYEKSVLGLARLRHSGDIPDQALIENPAEGIESVIVESFKFVDRPPSVTIRCDPESSDRLFEEDDEVTWRWMADRLADLPFLATEPEEWQVKRWRYSRPVKPVRAPFITLAFPGGSDVSTISACGDGFTTGAETGLEAALASAQALLDRSPW
ncbi:MAG: NAD(P)-binding protein [Solirubrobacterales bacterium]